MRRPVPNVQYRPHVTVCISKSKFLVRELSAQKHPNEASEVSYQYDVPITIELRLTFFRNTTNGRLSTRLSIAFS